MHEKRDKPKPRLCPFCGEKPVIYWSGADRFSDGEPRYATVECSNKDCPVGPWTDGYIEDEFETINRWNIKQFTGYRQFKPHEKYVEEERELMRNAEIVPF